MSDGTRVAQQGKGDASFGGEISSAPVAKHPVAQDAREWLANVIEFLPDAAFAIDNHKCIVAWNRACEIMTGVRKESLLGRGDYAYADALLGERRPILVDLLDMSSPEVEARYKYVRRRGDAIFAESYVPRLRDGQGAHLWGEAAPLFDQEGRRRGAIEIIRDVTEQHRVEQALRDSEERLRKVQRVARVGFLDWDLKTNQIFLSDETCELTGFKPEGQVTTPEFVARSVYPDDLTYTGENLNLAISGAKPYDIVHRHLRPDGGIVWVHAQAEISRDEDGNPARMLGTIVDVTPQKHIEEALRESEQKYRELVEHANSIILHWSRDGRIIFLNEFGLRFFGYSESEIVGRHVMGTIVPEAESSGRDLRLLMEEICKNPTGFEQNVNENIRRNGEHVWVAWTNKVVMDEKGQVTEILSIGADITERKVAEEKLQQLNLELEQRVHQRTAELNASNEQLRAKNSELKGFAYTVSHDLKAPLRGIAGYANELDRKHREGLSDRARFCLSQILTATSNLDQLIEDLLHYSRLDAETPSMTEVDLASIIGGILRDRQLIIAEQHIDVSLDVPFGTLRTWERGLVQILTNLIDNAIKYSRLASPPRLDILAEKLDVVWRLTVRDNGIGFDMKYHDRIFGLFNRLVRMDEFEGTGAGLAIVKKVVDKMGGTVRAESSPGAGASFIVEMPVRI
jgi:PAS domain S-box-containing protein